MTDISIEVSDLTFTHRGASAPALCSANLRVDSGASVALLGANGSGKSALCLAVAGLVPRAVPGSYSGTVTVRGDVVTELDVTGVARRIGVVLQDFAALLVATSVTRELAFGPENLAVEPDEIDRRVERYLDLLALRELRDREPGTLSGGQQQRLAVGTALST
jgi:energy-coupling factor transport system ATP-binding protein